MARFARRIAWRDRLDRHGLDDEPSLRHQESESLPIRSLERNLNLLRAAERNHQRRICALIANADATMHSYIGARHPLARQLVGALGCERVDALADSLQRFGQRPFD